MINKLSFIVNVDSNDMDKKLGELIDTYIKKKSKSSLKEEIDEKFTEISEKYINHFMDQFLKPNKYPSVEPGLSFRTEFLNVVSNTVRNMMFLPKEASPLTKYIDSKISDMETKIMNTINSKFKEINDNTIDTINKIVDSLTEEKLKTMIGSIIYDKIKKED